MKQYKHDGCTEGFTVTFQYKIEYYDISIISRDNLISIGRRKARKNYVIIRKDLFVSVDEPVFVVSPCGKRNEEVKCSKNENCPNGVLFCTISIKNWEFQELVATDGVFQDCADGDTQCVSEQIYS